MKMDMPPNQIIKYLYNHITKNFMAELLKLIYLEKVDHFIFPLFINLEFVKYYTTTSAELLEEEGHV